MMKRPNYFRELILICCMILLWGCGHRDEESWEKMLAADRMMEESPDSAMAVLQTIDTTLLKGKEERAKYGLQMSMALDKNYVDTTDFSVLQPAIDYYADNGSDNEKLRTYYYQGRIYQNKNFEDDAIKSFLKALDLAENATDTLTLARSYFALAVIYKNIYSFDESAIFFLKAAELYTFKERKELSLDCKLGALNCYVMAKDKLKSDSMINICKYEKTFCHYSELEFSGYLLSYALNLGTKEELKAITDRYKTLDFEGQDLLLMTSAYCKLGEPEKAKAIIERIDTGEYDYPKIKYIGLKEKIAEITGDYKSALEYYKEFSDELYKLHKNTYERETKFATERHNMEVEHKTEMESKSRLLWGFVAGIVFLVLVSLMLLFAVRSSRAKRRLALQAEQIAILENEGLKLKNRELEQEAEKLGEEIRLLTEERDNLKRTKESTDSLDEDVSRAMSERLEVLNNLIASKITQNKKYKLRYQDWLEKLTSNSGKLMASTKLALRGTNPGFVEYFESRGLTDDELGYVCLYTIGIKGLEIGQYMRKPGHFNISSAIRQKLGLGANDTNLGVLIREVMRRTKV